MSGAREESADLYEDVAPELRRIIDGIKDRGIAGRAVSETLESMFSDWTSAVIGKPADDRGGQTKELIAEYDRLLELLLGLRPIAEEALRAYGTRCADNPVRSAAGTKGF